MSQAIQGDKQIDEDFNGWITSADAFMDDFAKRGEEFALTNATKRNLDLSAADAALALAGRLQAFGFQLAMVRLHKGSCSGASKALSELAQLKKPTAPKTKVIRPMSPLRWA